MKVITFVRLSFIKNHQLVSTLTLPVLPIFRIRLGQLKLFFTVLLKLVVLGTFWIRKKKKLKIYTHLKFKNLYPSCLMDKEIRTFLESNFTTKENKNIDHNNKSVSCHKLPYVGSYSNSTKKKVYELCKTFCKNTNVRIVF